MLLTSLGRLPEDQWAGVFSAQLAKPLKASQLYNTLLQVLTAGEAREEKAELAAGGQPAMSSLRILLAEDNAMNRKVPLGFLKRLGYVADVASNGLEALEALEQQPYDVVLMDVQMPELDGLDATRRICEQWPPESRPHIIAMTANALPEDREACFSAGMNDDVAKPIRSEELAAALKRAQPLRTRDAGSGESGDAGFPEGEVTLEAAALQNLRDLGGEEFLTEVVDLFLAEAPAKPNGYLRRALPARGPSPGRCARSAADDRPDPLVQRRTGGAGQGADPDRYRDRVGTGRRRLHRDRATGNVHVRRRHRQCRGTTRVAYQGRQAADPHRREHPRRPRRRDRGRPAR